jgi:hypothetical protein
MLPTKNQPFKYTILEVPAFLLSSKDGNMLKNLVLTDTIALSENYFNTTKHTAGLFDKDQKNKRDIAVLQHWWQEDFGYDIARDKWGNGTIAEGLSFYLYIESLEKTKRTDAYLQARQDILTGNKALLADSTMPTLSISPVTRQVFFVLDALRTELGNEAVKQIIQPLYRQYELSGNIEPISFIQKVEMLLAANACSQDVQRTVKQHLLTIEELATAPVTQQADISLILFSLNMDDYQP